MESDWLRKWRDFSRPITQQGKAKPKPSELKIPLIVETFFSFPIFKISGHCMDPKLGKQFP